MTYSVKEIFLTLQGEGHHAGRPAVFMRFSGCNLWTGREQDRAKAICQFCDTDFIGTDGVNGGKFKTAKTLAQKASSIWCDTATSASQKYIVLTGGEPSLQIDDALVDALHDEGFMIAIESNGTLPVHQGIDWVCISPKAGADFVQTSGNELKLVYPQPSLMPEMLPETSFDHYYLQPMDGDQTAINTKAAIDYCLKNPNWNLSVQTHKILNIP